VAALAVGGRGIAAGDGGGAATRIEGDQGFPSPGRPFPQPQIGFALVGITVAVAERFFPSEVHPRQRRPAPVARAAEAPGPFFWGALGLPGDLVPEGVPLPPPGAGGPRTAVDSPIEYVRPVGHAGPTPLNAAGGFGLATAPANKLDDPFAQLRPASPLITMSQRGQPV
jgi:hypothetical protein